MSGQKGYEAGKKLKEKMLNEKPELYPCPYDMATMCTMDEPCKGCEVWSHHQNREDKSDYYETAKWIIEVMDEMKEPLSEVQKTILTGSLAVHLLSEFNRGKEVGKEVDKNTLFDTF